MQDIMAEEDDRLSNTADEEISEAEVGYIHVINFNYLFYDFKPIQIASSRLNETFDLDSDLVHEALAMSNPDEFNLLDPSLVGGAALPDFSQLDPETQERLQALLQAAGLVHNFVI